MVQRLLAAGLCRARVQPLAGAIDALVAEGATAADSARQVAERADVVMTALPTPESVEDGLRRAGRRGPLGPDLHRPLDGQPRPQPPVRRAARKERAPNSSTRPCRAGPQAPAAARSRSWSAATRPSSTRRCRCCRPSARTFGCAVRPARPGGQADQPAPGRRPHLGHRRGGRVRRAASAPIRRSCST